jgi:hypothetical protein
MGRLTEIAGGRRKVSTQVGGDLTGQQGMELGRLINQDISAMNRDIKVYSNVSQQIVTSILTRVDSNDVYKFLENDIVVSKMLDFSSAAQVANDILTTQINILTFSNYIVQKASDPNNLTNSNSAASNLQSLFVTSNAILLTSNINHYSNCVIKYGNFTSEISREKELIQTTITANNELFNKRAGEDLLHIYNLKQRITTDYATLQAFPVLEQGPSFPTILNAFQDAQFRLNTNSQIITSRSNTYISQFLSLPRTYLTDLNSVITYQQSNLNALLIAEYDVSAVNTQTGGVLATLRANQDVNIASLAINTPTTMYLKESFDISGWFFKTVNDLSENVMRDINHMSSLMNPLDAQSILSYASQMNSILSNLATTLNLENNLNSNFTNMIWYDSSEMLRSKLDSNTMTSNLVVQSNTIITSNLGKLKTSFDSAYENIRGTLQTSITEQYKQFTSNFGFVTRALKYINDSSTSAYATMNSSNYSGKYSYYYDYIGAMMGKNSNILRMAQTSNFPRGVIAPNPVMYNSNSLYDTNGNIILASTMYPYISDRYLGSNYNLLSNQFMEKYNTPNPTPESSRSNISQLQLYNVNFIVDVLQLSNYSNTIATDPNIMTNNGLKNYIGSYQSSLTNGNDPALKSGVVVEIGILYDRIKTVAAQVMAQVEQKLDQTQNDMYFFNDEDFAKVTTLRGNLKNYYLQADFIVNNNGQYFSDKFVGSNGVTGRYFDVYDLEVISVLGLYMSNDYNILNNILTASDLTGITSEFQAAGLNGASDIQDNIRNILSNAGNVYFNTLNTTNFVISMIANDVPQLKAHHLDSACFEFYPSVIAASNQLNTILTTSLPSLSMQLEQASNTYLTINNLTNLNNMSESLLYTSNNLYNNYLTASNFSNTLQGETLKLLLAFSNTYSNIMPEMVFKLPLFTGQNCTTTS